MKNRHYFVRVSDRESFEKLLDLCEKNGYRNVHSLTRESYPVTPPVVVVDGDNRKFGLTNVTCLAAMASQGIVMYDVEEMIKIDIFK